MELWFTEKQTESFGITAKIRETYVNEQTPFQHLVMLDTEEFGRMLVLDGMVMTTVKDEFVYHEMVAHPALATHPNPKKVLVVGGGDGGVIREIMKHPSVEKAVLVDIDGKVIEYSKKYLPEIACELDNPRVEVQVNDGYMHILNSKNEYDVIMVDSTEPVGPAAPLFERGFYQGIYDALKDDGLFVAQTDNPWFKADLIQKVSRDVKEIFPIVRVYAANIPTYPSGMWTFTMGSKKHDPLKVEEASIPEMETKYYSPRLHHAAFVLPKFVEDLCK
ncbi:polyamine aminopropyltransferase [Paenibacillus thiaminolyticus]|uniref:Polyamine aminopropyltransferase n=1 Tax=Paenibacillus thiaminolyticus TaxID=49283 RepID=A0A378XC92_PANTH|nr:polyamine aminopropyltransferase [Paenibacillus thiaminolyticus]MCY9535487.1 polyamine aminopropyltransferase [Paenibacillus thiaminolyticus]MCY9604867.1 polyamine aminopropyltransferase [Paenibacillus thiaminolyticus]MCY9610054.1 polyamine aminopropyltransferase [Paenibacillus thiaminolyticus]MCY9616137.1 polyamine aminopropyltransferase [Paenibacillus thiaminolyticus]MCY9621100.1 polyamine aminopropyltransferase [Paenibacillus thiaminolyticus]